MSALISYDAEYVIMLTQSLIAKVERLRKSRDTEAEAEFTERYYRSNWYKIKKFFGMKDPTRAELNAMLAEERGDMYRYMPFGLNSYPCSIYSSTLRSAEILLIACKEAQLNNASGQWTRVQIEAESFASMITVSQHIDLLSKEDHESN